MLQRTLDGALDILPHGPQPDGVRIVAQVGGLRLEVLSRKVQIRRLGAPGAFIGHGFGLLEGVVQFQSYPGCSWRMRFCTITL